MTRAQSLTPEQNAALAGAAEATEGSAELLRFTREGPAHPQSAWNDPYGEDPIVKLADATRLAIAAQGGPRDADEVKLLAALWAFLEPCGIDLGTAAHQPEGPTE